MTTTLNPPTTRSARPKTKDEAGNGVKVFNRLAATCMVLFGLIWLVPFAWALVTSLRPDNEITASPTSWWSAHWTLHAYSNAFSNNPIGWWYLNSFIISTLSVIFTVVVCSMIGFALAQLKFRGRSAVIAAVLIGLMVPVQAMVLPQFIEFRAIHLLGTYWALVLPAIAAPIAVFVYQAFMRGLPVELIEAARLDGAGWWRIYRRICMPLCKPATSAVAILTFVTSWNAFLWPLLVLTQTKSQTIPVGLSGLVGGSANQYAEVMASAVLGILPLLAVFLLFQRQIVQGVAQTGIK